MFDLMDVGTNVEHGPGPDLDPDFGAVQANSLITQLVVGGVDVHCLEGLHVCDVAARLQRDGVDVASLQPAQLSELVAQLADASVFQSVSDLLTAIAERR